MSSFQQLREQAARRQQEEYEAELVSTPVGQESFQLRQRAQWLRSQGRTDEALELFQRALALHPDDDQGAAAAAARYDLGLVLSESTRVTPGGLESAEQLLRKSLESPSRARTRLRRAQTLSTLASCLRKQVEASGSQAPQRLAEIEQLHRDALKELEGCGKLGLMDLPVVHLGLANFLGLLRRDIPQALRHYERALLTASDSEKQLGVLQRRVRHRARLGAVEQLCRRNQGKDLAQAERLLTEALREEDPQHESLEKLALARVLLLGSGPDRLSRAQAVLAELRPERLTEPEQWLELADLLRRAGAPDAALLRLNRFIQDAIHERSRTIADFEADTASLPFQSAAALAARLYVEQKQDALSAFLVLENTSGLRFAEMLASHAWRPETPFAQTLHAEFLRHNQRTYRLGEAARLLAGLPPNAQQDDLRERLRYMDDHPVPEDPSFPSIREALRRALDTPVPTQYLEERVKAGTQQVLQLKLALFLADQNYARLHEALNQELDAPLLTALLREHPDHTLLRIDVQRDLLAVAVWLEDGQLNARHVSVPVPPELPRLLRQAAENPKTFPHHARVSELAAGLDLSTALPTGRQGRAILLPSTLAARLPLAALGPPGARLVDRFDSLVWLPCLFPLRTRPAATPPRTGHVTVIPGGTQLHALALHPRPEGERRLSGAEATVDTLQREVREARTLCLYTHGHHVPGEMPWLELAGETLHPSHIGDALRGAERVEVWACQSGVHQPTDPLSPPANEGLGLDFTLVQQGVRTAIGTLWPVPELVTAAIAQRYRQQLFTGLDPAHALTEAQRWWLQAGLPELLRLLREQSMREAFFTFARAQGVSDEDAAQLVKDAPSLPCGEAEVLALETQCVCPVSWAGLRFVGQPGRDPEKPWAPVEDRPLTAEEQAQLKKLLELELPEAPRPFRERREKALARVAVLRPDELPAPAQALEVARRLRDRLEGVHQDNVRAALAWLHEALATPGLAETDRLPLSTEAAHLWLDLAWGEPRLPRLPEPVALARAGALLEALPASAGDDVEVARVRYQFLRRRAGKEGLEDSTPALQEALRRLTPVVHRVSPGTPEGLRAVTVALELLDLCEPEARASHARLLEAARRLADAEPQADSLEGAFERMQGALAQHSSDPATLGRALQCFTPRELAAALAVAAQARQPIPGASIHLDLLSHAFTRLEEDVWGHPQDDGSPLVQATGPLGQGYRDLLALYLEANALHKPEDAVHKLACMQFACDLRLLLLHRLARLAAQAKQAQTGPIANLWDLLRLRWSLHTALADSARLKAPEGSTPLHARPHPLDAFALPAPTLRAQARNYTAMTVLDLDHACGTLRELAPCRAQTLAFEAIRASARLKSEALALWKELLQREDTAREQLAPVLVNSAALGGSPESLFPSRLLVHGRSLPENTKWVRAVPPGSAVLGLSLLLRGELLLTACWNDGTGLGQQVIRLPTPQLTVGLLRLLAPAPDDIYPSRGRSGPRREAWAELEQALAPGLQTLLRAAQSRRPLRWHVLAPGPLRPLPLLGLRVEGRPLAAQVEGLSHLPCLDFGSLPPADADRRDFTACLISREHEEGTTRFGEAAIGTLRRVRSPELVMDPGQQREALTEVEALEAHARKVRTLRLYGVGGLESLNDSTAMIRLEGQQFLRDWSLQSSMMPGCEVVELWASTSPIDLPDRLLRREETDRIPGLAAGFLVNGAAAVIDLAWPVHDVIKALVCEQYGLLRLQHGHGPQHLAQALLRTAGMLEALRARGPYRTVREVLEQLDAQRQAVTRRPLPFADHAEHPAVASQSPSELVEELCQPVHLGAFRWWGA